MNRLIRILRALGCEGLANFGIGSPRQLPPILAVLRFQIASLNPWGHGYAKKQGRIKTRKALAANCRRTLGVVINPGQVLLLEGSKPSIRYILQALALVGKVVLPMPFYPGHLDGVIGAGCEPCYLTMISVGHFIKNLEAALAGGFRPVAVVLSFDNPRWLRRSKEDYVHLVELARQYKFVLISDEAYRDLAYDGKVWSVMQVPGWERLAVCIQTASKPFCMAGWKLGAIIARSELLPKLLVFKGRDSEGGSPAAQKAYRIALWCDWYPRNVAQMYSRRAKYAVERLRAAGVSEIDLPVGGVFVYFRLNGIDSATFAAALQELGFEVSPGERFGEPDCIRWCLNQGNWVTRLATLAVTQVFLTCRVEKAAGPRANA